MPQSARSFTATKADQTDDVVKASDAPSKPICTRRQRLLPYKAYRDCLNDEPLHTAVLSWGCQESYTCLLQESSETQKTCPFPVATMNALLANGVGSTEG